MSQKTDEEILKEWLPVRQPKEYEQHLRLIAMARAVGREEGAAEQREKDAEIALRHKQHRPLKDTIIGHEMYKANNRACDEIAQAIREQGEGDANQANK